MAHVETLRRGRAPADHDLPEWLEDALGWDDALVDDEGGEESERVLLNRLEGGDTLDDEAAALLDQLRQWADRAAEPADSKATALVAELERICVDRGRWTDDRVIVFTEYVDTQRWLAGLLEARGLGGERLGLLYGGMDERRREHLKAAFQAAPHRDPVRILLATDSASEGIDLQRHCHRVIHYDIPFNPNRLEQRIGRVDRHGQTQPVEVAHFVGTGWEDAGTSSYRDDLEFLSRVAQKVATERRDLGSVNPVLAAAVEARMLGQVALDPLAVQAKPTTAMLHAERRLREQVQRLRTQLDGSRERLHVAPRNVRRVVDTALVLAGQPPLADLGGGEIAPPALRSGWERTVMDLADPLTGEPRPLTFDPQVSGERDDVVLAHLEHPLVAQSTRLLRSAVWGDRTPLHRVAAVRADLPGDLGGLLVAVLARLVVVGADGARLHEEVVLSGRVLPERGRSRRLELEQPRFAPLRDAVEAALEPDACRPAPDGARDRLVAEWEGLQPLLAEDVRARPGRCSTGWGGRWNGVPRRTCGGPRRSSCNSRPPCGRRWPTRVRPSSASPTSSRGSASSWTVTAPPGRRGWTAWPGSATARWPSSPPATPASGSWCSPSPSCSARPRDRSRHDGQAAGRRGG